MYVCHKTSVRTETQPADIQLACSGDVLAVPYARNAVAVWNLTDDSAEVVFCSDELVFFSDFQEMQ